MPIPTIIVIPDETPTARASGSNCPMRSSTRHGFSPKSSGAGIRLLPVVRPARSAISSPDTAQATNSNGSPKAHHLITKCTCAASRRTILGAHGGGSRPAADHGPDRTRRDGRNRGDGKPDAVGRPHYLGLGDSADLAKFNPFDKVRDFDIPGRGQVPWPSWDVPPECRALDAGSRPDEGRRRRPRAASSRQQRGLDREHRLGYMGAATRRVCKTSGCDCETSEKSAVNSVTSVGNGVTVAQQTLTLFV